MAIPMRTADFSAIVRPALEATPEQREQWAREAADQIAQSAAAERAKFDALSAQEQRGYMAHQIGMMPRVAWAEEERMFARGYSRK